MSKMFGGGNSGKSAVGAAVQTVESGAVAYWLGMGHVHWKNGLDYKMSDTSDSQIPLDLAGGAVAVAASVAAGASPLSAHLRNLGVGAISVWAFRKAYNVNAQAAKQAGTPIGGSFGCDQLYGGFYGEDTRLDGQSEQRLLQALGQL